jgi:hypothetical protein
MSTSPAVPICAPRTACDCSVRAFLNHSISRLLTGALEDFTRLVETSIALGKPIVAIHIPYRVGLAGYGLLPNGKGGGNNALFDQRNGLEWIRRNISAFGGDPENITVGGESAGAFSVDAHLQASAQTAYFKRAVLMSGTLRVLRFQSAEARIELTRKAAAALGFSGEDWPERLAEVPIDDLIESQERIGLGAIHGVDDGQWFDSDVAKLERIVVPEWIDSIMIGDCGFEVSVSRIGAAATYCMLIHFTSLHSRASSGSRGT